VHLLRIPYAYLYPLIIMFCVIGVYEVAPLDRRRVDHADHGRGRLRAEEIRFDPAPLVLGLVIAPIFEMSLRQSLIMSDGNWTIFLMRPIAARLIAVSALLLTASAVSMITARRDWRRSLCRRGEGVTPALSLVHGRDCPGHLDKGSHSLVDRVPIRAASAFETKLPARPNCG
jgi:putative tricarboxylic transport membrane protein